jgi:hypothetical protein
MNIRNVVTKGLLATAISGALAVVPVALSTGTAHADSLNWDAIAQCESGGNWSTNSGNGHYGGLQFKPATWASNGGVGNPAMASRAEQIRVAENVLRTQGIKAWPKCGAQGGSPAVWATPTMPTATTGCQAIRSGSLFGLIDLRQVCSTFIAPLTGLGQPR